MKVNVQARFRQAISYDRSKEGMKPANRCIMVAESDQFAPGTAFADPNKRFALFITGNASLHGDSHPGVRHYGNLHEAITAAHAEAEHHIIRGPAEMIA